ncbi:metal-dependent hydrolase [Halobacillus sp. A1]|uniref:metal-dependent hydrolase n=1 Tax=Halobacillus sp. A1 TaxID=2880262 RepID=UPI0020A6856C|nr:metal-dependent hydrolase [Halobacillus sp. A1]MCP3031402.1 metal-dependent hydrolase [Halobacillus sp. A1]
MNTLHHGYWTFFAARKSPYVAWFIMGSIFPDVVYYVMFLYLVIERAHIFGSTDFSEYLYMVVHELFEHPVVSVLRQTGHSLFIWALIFAALILIKGRKLTKWTAFMYGWLGHVILDLLTHVEDAVPTFYPVSDYTFRSGVSYWDDAHYGGVFSLVNIFLIIISLLYLWVGKRRKNKKFTKNS